LCQQQQCHCFLDQKWRAFGRTEAADWPKPFLLDGIGILEVF
jgi:hypothetical protein